MVGRGRPAAGAFERGGEEPFNGFKHSWLGWGRHLLVVFWMARRVRAEGPEEGATVYGSLNSLSWPRPSRVDVSGEEGLLRGSETAHLLILISG